MVGEHGATASTGPAEVKPKENAMREVKILMLHGKSSAHGEVTIDSFSRYCGPLLRHILPMSFTQSTAGYGPR